MKTRNIAKMLIIALCISFALSQCSSSHRATTLSSSEVKNMIDSSRFVFVAERVRPMRGRSHYLTSQYDVVVKKDTLDCYLPYFGRSYQAPIDPTKVGVQFISVDFTYQANAKSEHQWDVYIKPRDQSDVQQLYFNIFDNGSATLNVTNTSRDPISFDGHIERVKK
jgi:hypothetical protein